MPVSSRFTLLYSISFLASFLCLTNLAESVTLSSKSNAKKSTVKQAQSPETNDKKTSAKNKTEVVSTNVKKTDAPPEQPKNAFQRRKLAKIERIRNRPKAEPRKTLRDMSYAELKKAKEKYLLANDTYSAIRFLEKMIPMCNNLDELHVIMLELADLYFDTGSLEQAGKMYREFSSLFPGNNKVEYASYKAVLCSFYSTLDTERDQTKTKDTIELAENFLTRQDVFNTHIKDVTEILTNCRKKLFDNEITIFTFYLNRGSYKSAQKRLDNMRKDFLGVLAVEPKILALECDLAEKQNNKELFIKKQSELAEKFPSYAQELAQAKTTKKTFLGRF